MLRTHGGRYRKFKCYADGQYITIENDKGRKHIYEMGEIQKILKELLSIFGSEWFPLANNVELLWRGEEKEGLATSILKYSPGDIAHAQGSSYLGVVLEYVGIFEWNGKKKGIKWRIKELPENLEDLETLLNQNFG